MARGCKSPCLLSLYYLGAHETAMSVQNATGRAFNLEEIRERVFGLANALSALYQISEHPNLYFNRNILLLTCHLSGCSEEDDVGTW